MKCAQRIVVVDLTAGKSECMAHEARLLFGGSALALALLGRYPTATESLVAAAGTLSGFPLPGVSRVSVAGSVDGQAEVAGMNGYVGAELKLAGVCALVFHGRANEPVQVVVRPDKVVCEPVCGRGIKELYHEYETTVGAGHFAMLHGRASKPAALIEDDQRGVQTGLAVLWQRKNVVATVVLGAHDRPLVPCDKVAFERAAWKRERVAAHPLYAHVRRDDQCTTGCFGCPVRCKGVVNGVQAGAARAAWPNYFRAPVSRDATERVVLETLGCCPVAYGEGSPFSANDAYAGARAAVGLSKRELRTMAVRWLGAYPALTQMLY